MDETQRFAAPARQDATAIRLARIGLVLAGIGALVVVFDLFGVGELGLALSFLGTLMAAPLGLGQRWYYPVASGAVGGIIARLLAGPHQTLAGWLAVLSALAVLVGACLGYPVDEEQ